MGDSVKNWLDGEPLKPLNGGAGVAYWVDGFPDLGISGGGVTTEIVPDAGSVLFTGYAPTVTILISMEIPTGSVLFTGYAPSVFVSVTTLIVPPVGSVLFSGSTPGVYAGLGRGPGETCARVVRSSSTPPLEAVGMPTERKGT